MSLGVVIFVDKYYAEDIINHEIGHTIQNQWMGPFFIFLVAIPSGVRYQLWDWLETRHYSKTREWLEYDNIWFEAQATKLGNKYK